MKRNKKITLGYGSNTPFYLYVLKYFKDGEYTEGIYSDLDKGKNGILKYHPKERTKVLVTEKMRGSHRYWWEFGTDKLGRTWLICEEEFIEKSALLF